MHTYHDIQVISGAVTYPQQEECNGEKDVCDEAHQQVAVGHAESEGIHRAEGDVPIAADERFHQRLRRMRGEVAPTHGYVMLWS